MKVYFYIITCKNLNIQSFYIGKTNTPNARMNLHYFHSKKQSHANVKIYKEINLNGGWDNWTWDIIFEDEYDDEPASLIKECELYDLLKPTLNSMRPIRLPIDHPERIEYNRQKKREFDSRERLKNIKPIRPFLSEEEKKEKKKEYDKKWYLQNKLQKIKDKLNI